jgi:hypothetical protein
MEDLFYLILRNFGAKKFARIAEYYVVSVLGDFALVVILEPFDHFHNLDPACNTEAITVLLGEVNETLNKGTISFRQCDISTFLFLSQSRALDDEAEEASEFKLKIIFRCELYAKCDTFENLC